MICNFDRVRHDLNGIQLVTQLKNRGNILHRKQSEIYVDSLNRQIFR